MVWAWSFCEIQYIRISKYAYIAYNARTYFFFYYQSKDSHRERERDTHTTTTTKSFTMNEKLVINTIIMRQVHKCVRVCYQIGLKGLTTRWTIHQHHLEYLLFSNKSTTAAVCQFRPFYFCFVSLCFSTALRRSWTFSFIRFYCNDKNHNFCLFLYLYVVMFRLDFRHGGYEN